MSGKPNDKKDGNSKRQKELGERVDEPPSEQESKEQTNPPVTRAPESDSKNIPEIKIKDTNTSAHLEEASTSSTGAIPKKGKLGKIDPVEDFVTSKDKSKAGSSKTSVPVQSKQDLESDEDGTSLLYPQSQNKPRSSKKGLSPVKIITNFFSKKSSEDVRSGPSTLSQSKGREATESEKDDAVEELTDITKTKKSKKRFAKKNAEPTEKSPSSKKSRKSDDGVHYCFGDDSDSGDDSSSECLPTQLTEELDVSSLSTDDVTSPLSLLSTDSPIRKVFELPEPETEKDKKSSSET